MNVVLHFISSLKDFCKCSSVLASSAEVASSKTNIGASFKNALAIANLCFSHPESLIHLSHTNVSSHSESFDIKSSEYDFLEISFIFFLEIHFFQNFMFFSILVLKRELS
ncbi:hypothetical protein HOF65_01590 [bacterium]|jgi:hypothetical protein|nr:hypothetical protein [bacterium]MBT3852720.1 hypothetical protein [bacterium]MBT4633649.1 hypothetical protein [bacterium]MBT6778849.1 hypothetical protein [bacterium]